MINPPILINQHQNQLRYYIYRLRYDVLVTEQKKHPEFTNHTYKILQEPLDSHSFLFASIEKGGVVGTCRVNYAKNFDDTFYRRHYWLDYFQEHNFANEAGIVSRMVLHPSYRGTKAFTLMVKGIFKELLNNAISVFIIDCTFALVPFYSKLGFLPYGKPFLHKDGMEVIPMILDANNPNRLSEIKSVLLDSYPERFYINNQIKNKVGELVSLYKNKDAPVDLVLSS